MIIDSQQFSQEYAKSIWELLQANDQEFVPPLSDRISTTQQNFEIDSNIQTENGLNLYFHNMIKQSFILALEKKQVVGFLSYIPNHNLCINSKSIICDYVTTIIINAKYRKQGIARKMYKHLFSISVSPAFATRTWSTNLAHIKLLDSEGFQLFLRIPNDRGLGIDTVYYIKKRKTKET